MSRPARCVPSPQRGEGQDEGVRDSQNNLQRPNPLTPTLSPLGRGSSLCQLLRTFMANASVLATRLGARVFLRANRELRAPAHCCHQSRNRFGPGKGRGGACLSVFRCWFRRFVGWAKARSAVPTLSILGLTAWASLRSAPPYKIEGSGTPANAGSPTAASCDAARALLERARLTAFHRGSHLGEYSIPKVSFRPGFLGRGLHGRYPPSPVPVQGCTSRPGHRAEGLIPKPPGSRLQIHPRAPPSLP